MKILSALIFLGGALAVSSRAPPPNKKFTQQHSEIIDAVARKELSRSDEVASKLFKQRGLEGLALRTIRHYLNQARKRIAQCSEGPALGSKPAELEEYESFKSICECLGDGDADDESLQSISEYEGDPSYGEVEDEPISDEHATYDSKEKVPAIFQHRSLANAVSIGRVEEARKITGKRRQKVHFTNAHKEVLREIVGNKRGRKPAFDDENLFEEASKAFEANGLEKVRKRNYIKHLKRYLRDIEDEQPQVASQQSDKISDSLTLDEKDLTEEQGMQYSQSEKDEEGADHVSAPRKTRKTSTQAHWEIMNIVAKRKGSVAVAREMFKERGLEDLSIPTIYKYFRLARERWQSIRDDEEEDLVEKNSSAALSLDAIPELQDSESIVRTNILTEAARDPACSSSSSIDDVYNLATEEFKRRNLAALMEKWVLFSKNHRDVLLEFIHERGYTAKEREVLFEEVSQAFLEKGLKKVSRNTFMKHLKRNVAALSLKNPNQPNMADDEVELADAVSGLVFLRQKKEA